MAPKVVSDDKIMHFISRFWQTKGYAPSVREIGEGVGLRSTSTVHVRLRALQRQGRLVSNPTQPRTLRVVKT